MKPEKKSRLAQASPAPMTPSVELAGQYNWTISTFNGSIQMPVRTSKTATLQDIYLTIKRIVMGLSDLYRSSSNQFRCEATAASSDGVLKVCFSGEFRGPLSPDEVEEMNKLEIEWMNCCSGNEVMPGAKVERYASLSERHAHHSA